MTKQHQAEIRAGDLVRLNGGGPPLTVIAVGNRNGKITVEWEVRKKTRCSLPPACVHRISNDLTQCASPVSGARI